MALRDRLPRRASRRPPRPGRTRPAEGELYLHTQIGGTQRDYCLAADDTVSLVDALPADATLRIVSFSDQDRCLPVPAHASRRQVLRIIARSFGETARSMRARRDTAVFATPAARLREFAQRVVPGIAVLHELLKQQRPAELPAVVGFGLGHPNDALLVQFVLDESGQIGQIQCVPRIARDDFPRTLRSFAARAKLALKGADRELSTAQILIFDNADLRAAVMRVAAYPRSGDFYGIPSTLLHSAGFGATVLACCAVIAWAGWQDWALRRLSAELATNQAQLTHSLDRIRQLAHTRFDALTALATIDPYPAIARASTLLVPGGHVDVRIDRDRGMTLTTHVPLGDDPSGVRLPPALQAPCTEQAPAITSTLTEIDLTYGCPTLASDAALAELFRARR